MALELNFNKCVEFQLGNIKVENRKYKDGSTNYVWETVYQPQLWYRDALRDSTY